MIIISDTREKPTHTWKFDRYLTEGESVVVDKLDQGDYSLKGKEHLVSIERKNSVSEIIANFASGKERFKRELVRLKENHKFSCIMCSFTLSDVFSGSKFTKVSPSYIISSMIEIEYKYGIPIHLIGDGAEYFTYRFLRKIWDLDEKGKSTW